MRVRGQQWVVSRRSVSSQPRDELAAEVPGRTLITLTSVSDDDLGDELTVTWEIEPSREVLPATRLPTVTPDGWDDPQALGAFLDAVRWGTVASAGAAGVRAGQPRDLLGEGPRRQATLSQKKRRTSSRSTTSWPLIGASANRRG